MKNSGNRGAGAGDGSTTDRVNVAIGAAVARRWRVVAAAVVGVVAATGRTDSAAHAGHQKQRADAQRDPDPILCEPLHDHPSEGLCGQLGGFG